MNFTGRGNHSYELTRHSVNINDGNGRLAKEEQDGEPHRRNYSRIVSFFDKP